MDVYPAVYKVFLTTLLSCYNSPVVGIKIPISKEIKVLAASEARAPRCPSTHTTPC